MTNTTISKKERKLCIRIYEVMQEMAATPPDNPKRFGILKHRLERLAEEYKSVSGGKDDLTKIVAYARGEI